MRTRLDPSQTRFPLPGALCALLVLSVPFGCRDNTSAEPVPVGSAPAPSAPIAASAPPAAESAEAAEQPASLPLELQELTFTSEVKNKEPVDTLLAAEPGKRVWAHLRLRNRDELTRKIHLEFRVNDDKRTTLDLQITKSWSYRTWAYNTLLDSDKTGTVSLTVTDDTGAVLAETGVPIAAKARTKPYVAKAK